MSLSRFFKYICFIVNVKTTSNLLIKQPNIKSNNQDTVYYCFVLTKVGLYILNKISFFFSYNIYVYSVNSIVFFCLQNLSLGGDNVKKLDPVQHVNSYEKIIKKNDLMPARPKFLPNRSFFCNKKYPN